MSEPQTTAEILDLTEAQIEILVARAADGDAEADAKLQRIAEKAFAEMAGLKDAA